MDLVAGFKQFVTERSLFTNENKLLLATSGGVDSVVLTHLLHKLKYKFVVAHCNFNLRGDESDLDEGFVKQLANNYKVQFYIKNFNTTQFKIENGGSTQMAARELRYTWFETLRKELSFDFILTAHHKNDSLETILLNLVRGTGLAGFHGIQPKQGFLIRPLLYCTKENLVQYAQENFLTWRDDTSNSSNKYARNLIRNKVIPMLKELNPSLEETIQSTSELVLLSENYIQSQLEASLQDVVLKKDSLIFISIKEISNQKEPLFVLFQILRTYGFNLPSVKRILNTSAAISGKVFYSDNFRLLKDRKYWIVDRDIPLAPVDMMIEKDQESVNLSSQLSFEIKIFPGSHKDFEIFQSPDTTLLDADKLTFPLKLRNWKIGDKIKPDGMDGTKKVSDLLNASRINLFQKEKILVLESNNEIACVFPLRVSKFHALNECTRNIFLITKITR